MLFRAETSGEAYLKIERDDDGKPTGRYIKGTVHPGDEWNHVADPKWIPAMWARPIDEEAKRQYAVMHKETPKKYRRKEWVDLSLLEPPKRGPGRPKKEQEPEAAEATPES